MVIIAAIVVVLYLDPVQVVETFAPTPVQIHQPERIEFPKTRNPIFVPNAAKMETIVSANVVRAGLPVKVVSVEFVGMADKNAGDKIDMIISGAVVPVVYGRSYRGVVRLSGHCASNEPCGTRVLAPNQLDWTDADVTEFRQRLRNAVEDEVKPGVQGDDMVYEVHWITTDTGERFTTYLIASKEGVPRFEPILSLSTREKICKENGTNARSEEGELQWEGEALNGLGLTVVRWQGHVTYRYQSGKLLTPDLCPNKSCLQWTPRFMWQVDDEATTVTTSTLPNTNPDEKTLSYRLIWSIWYPNKVVVDKFAIEMPPLKGNAVAGSFNVRGDGTWNKNN